MVQQNNATSHPPALGLRERRRQETLLEINRAALDLFELHGAASTTVDEIARRAGVSPSTFFRCFATKEDSVCGSDREFEAEITAWLDSVPPEDVDLDGIEALYERSLCRLMNGSGDVKERLLRTRRLIASDDHLRGAAVAADAIAVCRVTEQVARKVASVRSPSYARLLIEAAAVARRIAFDAWVARVEGGDDADLVEIYRATRRELREVVSG
ncbi:TetR/AcrR family transcriptional regulator [Rhodococcus phenolicus]|uniref:TetR/AcrR family transcriptional regulator n=1 Tax=Rhodococcus phenolicus TaxID=263849 RepID=UPI00083029C4|nr:TetR/AcrR family transcriptional regulator [Rhodococcus phenolicus]